MPTTQDITQKFWNLCSILRDGGTCPSSPTSLLGLLADGEGEGKRGAIHNAYRWDEFVKKDGSNSSRPTRTSSSTSPTLERVRRLIVAGVR